MKDKARKTGPTSKISKKESIWDQENIFKLIDNPFMEMIDVKYELKSLVKDATRSLDLMEGILESSFTLQDISYSFRVDEKLETFMTSKVQSGNQIDPTEPIISTLSSFEMKGFCEIEDGVFH